MLPSVSGRITVFTCCRNKYLRWWQVAAQEQKALQRRFVIVANHQSEMTRRRFLHTWRTVSRTQHVKARMRLAAARHICRSTTSLVFQAWIRR